MKLEAQHQNWKVVNALYFEAKKTLRNPTELIQKYQFIK